MESLTDKIVECFTEDVNNAEQCVKSVLTPSSLNEIETNIQQDVQNIKSKYPSFGGA